MKNIFFISSALIIPNNNLSIYSKEERFEQTVNTIQSIEKYAGDSKIIVFDSSIENDELLSLLPTRGKDVSLVYTGTHPSSHEATYRGMKNIAETISFILCLQWFFNQNFDAERAYKISGRYELTDRFDPKLRPKDHFVFKKSVESWMPKERQYHVGANRLYDTRLYHMDFSLLPTFQKELNEMLFTSVNFGLDVEHSIYKSLHKYNVTEVDVIGVQGHKAPNGEYVNE